MRQVHVSLLVPNLLTWDGERPVTGGLERYVWQLLRLMRRLGYEVDVHQNGNADWVKEVDGFRIHGHGVAALSLEASVQEMNRATGQVLYATPYYRGTFYKPGSLVIAHGVWWDSAQNDKRSVEASIGLIYDVLSAAKLVVACDYNFLNVARATVPWQAHKIRVIPNFADCRAFRPAREDGQPPGAGDAPGDGPLRLLYPRRIARDRGYDLFLAAGRKLIDAFPGYDLRLWFAVDRNLPEENARLAQCVAKEGLSPRTVIASYGFDEMPEVYRRADIVAIPSPYSEGTSFSCVEALASGCAVVATNVGGLTNLILDGYNGLLVDPTLPSLTAGLARLVADPELRSRLGVNARQTAFAFDLPRWERAWEKALADVYGPPG